MNAEEIKVEIEALLAKADGAAMDRNYRVSALERASVWIQYLAAEKA